MYMEKIEWKQGLTDEELTKHSIKNILAADRMSNLNKGNKLSKEVRNKLSKKHKDKKLSDAHKKSISNSMRGKKHNSETRKKISIANTGKKFSKITRSKISDAAKRRKPPSNETRKKLSMAAKLKRMRYVDRDKQILNEYNKMLRLADGNNYGLLKILSDKYGCSKANICLIIKKTS